MAPPRMPGVLQVVLSLNPGGTERLVVELAKRLSARMPMAVCCLDEKGAWAGELESAGVPVHTIGRRAGFSPSLGAAVAQMARDHHASVLHCHHYSPFIYGALARCRSPRLRVVYTEHGHLSDAPPSRKRRLANSLFARLPHAVYAVSHELRQHIVQEGFAPDAVGVIYNGIAVGPLPCGSRRQDVRARLSVDEHTLVIGTIARLDPVKDLQTLIKAVANLPAAMPVVLLIVGDGPERAALESATAESAASGRVRFIGQRTDARDWLAGCDVYVNSSINEGVSLTILEAMAAGLPVIATRVGGTPEVVDDASGRLVPSRDVGSLTATIHALGRDGALRAALGAAGRRRVEVKFTLERMVREYEDVYRRLA